MKRFSQLPRQTRQLFVALSLALISFSLVNILGIPLFSIPKQLPQTAQTTHPASLLAQQTPSSTTETGSVLGSGSGRRSALYIRGGDDSYSSGGLIAMSTQAEPVVEIYGYQFAGRYSVTIFKTDEHPLLKYLEYDKDYQQKNAIVDTSVMTQVTSFDKDLQESNTDERLELPIQDAGIYYVQLKNDSKTIGSFIVRSNFGAVAKKADNETLLWAQDFDNMRRLPGMNYTMYSLSNGQTALSSGQTDDQGLAKMSVNPPPDLAVLKKDDRVAILPLNLQYLSSWGGYSYNQFKPNIRQTKFFTFTDRPLYRPGDKVYFKSILRDDDDARYSIPSGTAQVILSRGYGDESPVFSKQFGITSDGAVDGEINLPEDLSTGEYEVKIKLSDQRTSRQYIDVEYFRKPEYSISVDASQRQIVAQDNLSFTINGSYFSGQPLANKEVTYTVYSGNYYDYQYYYPEDSLSNAYRYGGTWGNDTVTQGTATLDTKGKATVNFKSSIQKPGHSQVYSIEISYEDETGNPSFDRKNILVFDGEYSIYRDPEGPYSNKVNQKARIDLILKSNTSSSLPSIPLTATVSRSTWVKYEDQSQKYPSYREEKETLPSLTTTSDGQGHARFEFTPPNEGSYDLVVSGKDSRGNIIERHFYLYVSDQNGTMYGSQNQNQNTLTLNVDKEQYEPTDNVQTTITSYFPFRDVLLTFERDRVNRYQVVQLNAATTTLSLPLENTDIPNIFLRVTSYAGNDFDNAVQEIKLNTNSKKLNVSITPDRTTYGPSDEVKLNVETTDSKGNPLAAEVAVWSVDKSIFELSDSQLGNIFDTFWDERYLNTATTHSLEGITVNTAERGGGCFVAGTLVTLVDGSQKPIEEIKSGDHLLTRTTGTDNKLMDVEVKNTHQQKDTGYFVVNNSLKVTPNHFLWINDQWQTADQLQIGDQLWSAQSGPVTVSSLEWITHTTQVYNLETSGNHTFLANGYWVHNQKGGNRSVFKDTAYWNPRVQTDSNGRAQIVFKLPDNLTTWVIAGVGATRGTVVGQNTQEVKVSKNVVIRPVLPNVLQQDDPILIEGIVQNFTNQSQDFTVSLGFDSGEVWPTETQSITIAANDSDIVKWNVVPRKESETAKLTFSAKTNQPTLSDTVEQKIEVRPFGFVQESAQTGNNTMSYPITLVSKLNPNKSNVTLNLASSIVTSLPAAVQYLIDYPYGCVEQTTSRFVPTVIAVTHTDLFKDVLADKDLHKFIAKGVNRLQNLQNNNGSWSWWGHRDSDPFISAYVVEYLLKAQKAGYEVNEDMLARSKNYFEQMQAATVSTTDQIAQGYALSLFNSDKKHPIQDFEVLPPDLLALAVMTNVQLGDHNPTTNGLARLTALAKTQGKEVYWERGTNERFGSREASTALAARAVMMGGGERQLVVGSMQYLLNHRRNYYWGNTFATAQITQAVSDYSEQSQELKPNFTYQVNLDGKTISSGAVNNAFTPIKPIHIPLKLIKPDGSSIVEIKKDGTGELYSTLVNHSFITDKETPAISHGTSITRRYISADGEEVIPAVGDVVTVELTVNGLNEDEAYGVIQDHLPAGMIPVNINFENEQAQKSTSYWRYSEGLSSVEYTEDGAILSLYQVKAGAQKLSYKARVINQGEFLPPPATFSLMYNPEVYAQSAITPVKIGSESIIIPGNTPQKQLPTTVKTANNDWKIIVGASLLLTFFAMTFIIETIKHRKAQQMLTQKDDFQRMTSTPPSESADDSDKK